MLPSAVIRQETPPHRCARRSRPSRRSGGIQSCGHLRRASEIVVAAARQILCCTTLRVYGSDDLIGVEVARAMSSVIALASGVCDVLSSGAASPTLVSRSAAESARLGMALGGRSGRSWAWRVSAASCFLADFELGRLIGASIRLAKRSPDRPHLRQRRDRARCPAWLREPRLRTQS